MSSDRKASASSSTPNDHSKTISEQLRNWFDDAIPRRAWLIIGGAAVGVLLYALIYGTGAIRA